VIMLQVRETHWEMLVDIKEEVTISFILLECSLVYCIVVNTINDVSLGT